MTERQYATTECPHCEVRLEPPPWAKTGCPYCRRVIYVATGPDGFTYLLQAVDLPVIDDAWAEYYASLESADPTEPLEFRTRGAVAAAS